MGAAPVGEHGAIVVPVVPVVGEAAVWMVLEGGAVGWGFVGVAAVG